MQPLPRALEVLHCSNIRVLLHHYLWFAQGGWKKYKILPKWWFLFLIYHGIESVKHHQVNKQKLWQCKIPYPPIWRFISYLKPEDIFQPAICSSLLGGVTLTLHPDFPETPGFVAFASECWHYLDWVSWWTAIVVGWFQGLPIMGLPKMVGFLYYSHTIPISLGILMGLAVKKSWVG